mgnify:CR=1 FL=1
MIKMVSRPDIITKKLNVTIQTERLNISIMQILDQENQTEKEDSPCWFHFKYISLISALFLVAIISGLLFLFGPRDTDFSFLLHILYYYLYLLSATSGSFLSALFYIKKYGVTPLIRIRN